MHRANHIELNQIEFRLEVGAAREVAANTHSGVDRDGVEGASNGSDPVIKTLDAVVGGKIALEALDLGTVSLKGRRAFSNSALPGHDQQVETVPRKLPGEFIPDSAGCAGYYCQRF